MPDWQYQALPNGHTYTVGNLTIILDSVREHTDSLTSWVELHATNTPTSDVPIVMGNKNLKGSNTVRDLAREWAEEMTPASTPDRKQKVEVERERIGYLLRHVIFDVIRRTREGPEPVDLWTQAEEAPVVMSPWLVRGWLQQTAHTRLIAAGGTGKSYIATALGIVISTGLNRVLHCAPPRLTGPVAYLDWEADKETHTERLRAVARGADISPKQARDSFLYYQMSRRLARVSTSMAASIERAGVVALIIDSNMLARGASGEGGAEDTTVAMFEALREIGRPALIIDHKTKKQAEEKLKGGYGSVGNQTQVRYELDAYMSRSFTSPDTDNPCTRIALSNTKSNNTTAAGDQFLEIEWENDGDRLVAVRFAPKGSMYEGVLADQNAGDSSADKIRLVLTEMGSATIGELAQATGLAEATIRSTKSRKQGFIEAMPGTNPTRYRLADDPDVRALPTPY